MTVIVWPGLNWLTIVSGTPKAARSVVRSMTWKTGWPAGTRSPLSTYLRETVALAIGN